MKKSLIIALMLLVLAGTAFTAVKNNRQSKVKPGICCKKTSLGKPGKKGTAPVHYLPVVNFF